MLSVIIPTLNEAANISSLLQQLQQQRDVELEIIVVDGGSTDATRKTVEESGAIFLQSQPGRGVQLNAGAKAATADYLLFLHADSQFTWDDQLCSALAQLQSESGTVAGHFCLKFETSDAELSRKLRYFEEKTRLNRLGTWNGDQGLMIATAVFELTGGFWQKLPFMEDQDFGQRFFQMGRFITFDSELKTSARRFEQEGYQQRVAVNAVIMAMFHLQLDDFFHQARGLYRAGQPTVKLDPAPFLQLALKTCWKDGPKTGMKRFYRIGRYTTRNSWQLVIRRGIRTNQVDVYLARHDKWIKPAINHFIGYTITTVGVLAWALISRLTLNPDRDR